MRRGKLIAALAMALAVAGAARASAVAPLERDAAGRLIARVHINGQGPYRMIVDTGASRTVIAPRVARALGLDVDAGPSREVLSVIGAGRAQFVRLAHMSAGGFERTNVPAALLAGRMLGDADGLIGADGFDGKRLTLDFAAGAMTVEDAEAPARAGAHVVRGRLRFGHVFEAPVTVGGVAAHAIIDTGAEGSFINAALRAELGARARGMGGGYLVGAAGARSAEAKRIRLRDVRIGPHRLSRLDAFTAELPMFRDASGRERPGLVLGVDAWRGAGAVSIDYARAELHIDARS